tara:strand:- start:143 stop:487 length:345 start_codon:yes stop_codon:yes gene_type:complete
MKKGLIIVLLFITSLSFGQDKTLEYLSIKVQYGIKTTGIVNDVHVDIGSSGQHSLSGKVFNDDGVVKINGREYRSVIDLLNYFGKNGWTIFETRQIKILNEEYYQYLLVKETKD